MQKKVKVAAGSAAALAMIIAGGLAIALPAQAAPVSSSVSVVAPVDATDTDNVQNEVEDGTADGTGTESATESATESTTESSTENTSDDINGVAVEDGTQD